MKLKKILKHMTPNERIRIYESNGVWVNSLASSPEILKHMDRKVKRISSGFYSNDATLTVTLEDEECKILKWIIKKLVTLYWKKTHFHTYSWGVDENVDLYVLSEESYPDRHRFGTKEGVFGEVEE